MEYEFNECQSSLEELKIYDQPQEIQEQFFDYINNVPFIQWMISKDRPHAKDLPRDEKGRIIFDVVHPPILDNMDYFREAAISYKTNGVYSQLRPNPNPNSEFKKYWDKVLDRSWNYMLRESDGMWIPGDMYFYLNFDPIIQTKIKKGSKRGERVVDFPECWDGVLFRYFYIYQAQNGGLYDKRGGLHGCEISSRGKSKSYSTCSMMAKRFVIGESKEVSRQVKCLATAYQKQYLTTDGILNKFQAQIDFLAQNTPFPNKRLKSSLQDMAWTMGYVDLNTGTRRGTLNEVSGLSAKDDPGKVRGKRQNLIIVEEFGSFGNVLEMYNIMRPSVEEGDYSFGQMYLIGTAGEDESDFQGAQEIVYNPKGYKMYALPNVYDKLGQGRKEITYFFPGYLSRKGCYDENGNSNVTKALLEILIDRYTIKYNSSDINSITRAIAEIPITPQEAITRTRGNMFPVTLLNERINEIDNNPTEFDTVYTGTLQQKSDGSVEFVPTSDAPIREFPTKDNKAHPYDTKVYTYEGIKKWGDIKIGDKLIGTDGNPTTVIDIPFDGVTDVYELTLKDGRKVRASGNHKWNIIDTNGYHKILSTKEMYADGKGWYRVCKEYKDNGYRNLKYFIPKNNGVNYDKKELPIMPYLLGLMLGDGCICGSSKNRANFTASAEDMKTYKSLLPYYVHTVDDRHHYIHVNNIKDHFIELGLENARSATKFIPDIYKTSSREDRLELLRGLCDTDGSIEYGGNVGYITISKQLADDIIELARSLGINCNLKSVHLNNCGHLTYSVIFYTNERLFNLERKYNQQKITKNRYCKTGIYNIEYIGKERCKCVTVDAKDSCYLIGDYITTHNCKGAIEIFEMPQKDKAGNVFQNRYILGHDPVDNDGADTMSLSSTFVLDLFTDKIVAEYTGRQDYADDNFEIVRLLCLFYNGKCLYENNKRGIFAYFSSRRCLHLLADTPDYLVDKQLIKFKGYGNSSKGVAATKPINDYANTLVREWLIKPVTITVMEDGEEVEKIVPNLHFIRNRALLKELVLYNPDINVDRLRSLGMVMLYRGQFVDMFEGNLSRAGQQEPIEEDDYFKHYDEMIKVYEKDFN